MIEIDCNDNNPLLTFFLQLQPYLKKMADNFTQKHRNFVDEPMGNKGVTAVPGIGETIGRKMEARNIYSAKQIYGHFLLMNKDEFKDFIQEFGANGGQQTSAYNAVRDWDTQHN